MPAIGLYFAGLTQVELNALRARLNRYAKIHGYIASRGPTAGKGNLAQMLVGIDAGQIALISLNKDQDQWKSAIKFLEAVEEPWATSLILGLLKALENQKEVMGCQQTVEDGLVVAPHKQKAAAPD